MRAVRIMGLDVGTRTIGVAISDELGLAAHPHSALARHSRAADVGAILALRAALEAETLVIGLPLALSGAEGPAAKRSRQFGGWLQAEAPGVAIEYEDERFSTAAAQRVLIAGGVRRDARKAVIDQQAAVIILQQHLDRLRQRPA